MVKELINYIKHKKSIYFIIAIAIIFDYGTAIMPTQIVKTLIDEIDFNTLTLNTLNLQLVLLISITVVGYIAIYLWIKLVFSESAVYKYSLRKRLFHKLITMKVPYYDKFKSGDMMTRFTSDIDAISELLGYGFMTVISSVVSLGFILPAMISINWQVTLLAAIPLIIVGWIITYIGKKQDEAVEISREAVANLSNEVLEVVEGVRVMRAYGKRELGQKHFQEKTRDLRHKTSNIIKFSAMFGRVAIFGLSISTMIIIGLGGYFMSLNQITLGDVVALQLYSWMLMDPMWMLSDMVLVYQSANTSFNKVSELLTETDNMPKSGTTNISEINAIQLKDYNFIYNHNSNDLIGLKHINLTLKKGQTLGIVGKTGSGKTTLIRQFLMQYPVGHGEFNINGLPVSDYKREDLEKLVAYVPQEHVLFSRSVKENLLVGNQNASIIDIAVAVKAASFTNDLERMSDGIDTLVGEKGVSISGGQKQRISIARAFLKDAELLILDDSLSAVDAKTEREIIENIQEIRQGKTNIIVTHRLSAVNHADYIIVLDNGEIVEEGTPNDLLAINGWYTEQYNRQQLEGDED